MLQPIFLSFPALRPIYLSSSTLALHPIFCCALRAPVIFSAVLQCSRIRFGQDPMIISSKIGSINIPLLYAPFDLRAPFWFSLFTGCFLSIHFQNPGKENRFSWFSIDFEGGQWKKQYVNQKIKKGAYEPKGAYKIAHKSTPFFRFSDFTYCFFINPLSKNLTKNRFYELL